MATVCPAIKIEDFNYINNFALIIKMIPNSYQVITDKPIDLSVDITPKISIDNQPVGQSLGVDPKKLVDKYNNTLKNLKNNINDKVKGIFNLLDDPAKAKPDCDPTKDDPKEDTKAKIEIKDIQGNLIKEVTANIKNNPTITCTVDNTVSLVEAFQFPETFDVSKYEVKDPVVDICNLPDSAIKNQVNYVINEMPNKIENFNSDLNADVIDSNLKNLFKNMTGNEINSEKDLHNYYSDINQKTPQVVNPTIIKAELGIPIATLDPNTPVILQIINKKIQVMNLFDGTSKNLLEIDKEIDLNKVFTVIFKTNGFLHELYLFFEEDSTIYKKQAFTPKNLSIYNIGVDPKARKNYCGLVLDIQILTYSNNPVSDYLTNNYTFEPPVGSLAFYDWYKKRINRNLVYPSQGPELPIKMYGMTVLNDKYQLDTKNPNYYFMRNTFLSEFFCSRMLNQEEWSLWFWFNVEKNSDYYNDTGFSDFRTIIDDFINKNSLSYDFGTKVFKFDFGGNVEYKPYVIQTDIWYYCVLKYNKKKQKLYFSIELINATDIKSKTIFKIEVKKLKFSLTSMLAKFDGWNYGNYFTCKFGTLAIFNQYTDETEEYDNFLKNKLVIKQLGL